MLSINSELRYEITSTNVSIPKFTAVSFTLSRSMGLVAVVEAKMLYWTSGVTRYHHLRNEDIRGPYRVAPIVEKLEKRRLRWCGHINCADENSLANVDLNIKDDGKQSKGYLKQRLIDTVNSDLESSQIHSNQAHDPAKCCNWLRYSYPISKHDKD